MKDKKEIAEMTVESEIVAKRALGPVATKNTVRAYSSVPAQADGGHSVGNIPAEGGHRFERGTYLMEMSTMPWRSPRKVT